MGRGKTTVPARQVWNAILESQMETGTPYMTYKDSVNRKNNQSNLGTIKGSNLCAEIVEYTSDKEIAVCNLASIILSSFVDQKSKTFDFDKLFEVLFIKFLDFFHFRFKIFCIVFLPRLIFFECYSIRLSAKFSCVQIST